MGLKVQRQRKNALALIGFLMVLTSLSSAYGRPRTDIYTNVGSLGVAVTNLGYVGNGFENSTPSGEYPIFSNVEHLFLGGIWIGAHTASGEFLVSTGAQDASSLSAGEESREFKDLLDSVFETKVWSNLQNAENFNGQALATQHIELAFDDFRNTLSGHTPIGLKVILRVLAWSSPFADDFVILDYAITNVSGTELSDIYVGYWNDTSVGNTDQTNPYDSAAAVGWNWYDDVNGAWGPSEWVPEGYTPDGDNDIWMMWERDDDGDEGLATSWIGTRLLGSVPEPTPDVGMPPVSYNAWGFGHAPDHDDAYATAEDPEDLLPGKYQIMANGAFTVGETEAVNFDIPSDWVGLLSTGPFRSLAPDSTLYVTFAICAGADSLGLLDNSKVAQQSYDEAFRFVTGPPSPQVDYSVRANSIVMQWVPGDSLDAEGNLLVNDSALRSPEHHISDATAQEDFQGYRIYRYQGAFIPGAAEELATLVAEFDIIDGVGYDTGLPPLNANGLREYVDTNLLNGYPYYFSVVAYAAPNENEGLPELPSGFYENAEVVFPGPAAADQDKPLSIGVYPNPYRTGSLFEKRTGQRETSRRLYFTGLPPRCRIQVFNLVGEVVKVIDHDDPSSGQHEWKILSEFDRVISSGLYVYAVENLATGEVQRGKLVIIK